MRPLRAVPLALAFTLAGCAVASPAPADDPGPLAAPEEPLTVRDLPGTLASPWPIAIAQAGGRYLLPWRDASGLHARIVGADGERDLDLGAGSWLGAAARGDRFVVALARGSTIVVRFLDGSGEIAVPVAGPPVRGIASDGDAILVAATEARRSAKSDNLGTPPLVTAALIRPEGVESVEVGLGSSLPALYGDPQGFVVGGRWLISADGAGQRSPAAQIPSLRLFARGAPVGESVTIDGSRWLALPDPIDGAFADPRGLEIVASGRLLHVGLDLTQQGAGVAVPLAGQGTGFLRGISGERALWEDAGGSSHWFAILDRSTLAPTSPLAQISGVFSRTVAVALGTSDVLFAWLTADGRCHYARWAR